MIDEPFGQMLWQCDEISIEELDKLLVGELGVGETERHFDENGGHVPVLKASKTGDDSGGLVHAAGAHEHDRMASAVEGNLEGLLDELLGDGLPGGVGLPLFGAQMNELNVVFVAKGDNRFEGRLGGELDQCAELETLQKLKVVRIDLLCAIDVGFDLRKHFGRRQNGVLIRVGGVGGAHVDVAANGAVVCMYMTNAWRSTRHARPNARVARQC